MCISGLKGQDLFIGQTFHAYYVLPCVKKEEDLFFVFLSNASLLQLCNGFLLKITTRQNITIIIIFTTIVTTIQLGRTIKCRHIK